MTSGSNRRRARPPEERFWPKVRVINDWESCWEWQGYRKSKGYGMFNVDNTRPRLAHRFAFEISRGPIPEGMAVCHRCDNPPCVRPSHLFLGSLADNNRDMASKGRHVGSRRLSREQAAEIRRRYAAGGVSQAALGREFGVTQSAVYMIVNGKRHLMPGDQESAVSVLERALVG